MVMRRFGYKQASLLDFCSTARARFFSARCPGPQLFSLSDRPVCNRQRTWISRNRANPLIAQLGAPESAVRRLNFSQAFIRWAPYRRPGRDLFIFSGVELKPAQIAQLKLAGTYNAYLQQETMRVIVPTSYSGRCPPVAFLIFRTPFPAIAGAQSTSSAEPRGSYRELLRYRISCSPCCAVLLRGRTSGHVELLHSIVQTTPVAGKNCWIFSNWHAGGFGVGRFGSSHWMKTVSASTLMGLFAVAK